MSRNMPVMLVRTKAPLKKKKKKSIDICRGPKE
jgi:hypothetical protein